MHIYNVLTSTVISITHCGTVSFSSMDSVSPPESLHSNLQTQDKTDATKCVRRSDQDNGGPLPEQSSASCFSKDDWGVWWHLEITVSPLYPVLWFSIHCEQKNGDVVRRSQRHLTHLLITDSGGETCSRSSALTD